MKRMYLPLIVIIMFLLTGCAAQVAIGVADIAVRTGVLKDLTSSSEYRWLREGKEIERYQVGNYEVLVSDGRADDLNYIFFSAYDSKRLDDPKLRVSKRLALRKDKKEDMQVYDEYSKTETINKKKFIKELFLKNGFDLGPVESETPDKSPKEAIVSAP